VIQIVWEFRVARGKEREFERHYGPNGTWAKLFRKAPEFVGTDLLRDSGVPGRYLTIDHWKDAEAYDLFRNRFADEYRKIDEQMERLTKSETRVGVFSMVDDSD
jgi:quinol monooxygenase YgiN